MDTITLELLYRDGANYKTYFKHLVEVDTHPEITQMVVGNEITMGDLGTPDEMDFFGSEVHPYTYNVNDDHNILEIVGIEPDHVPAEPIY